MVAIRNTIEDFIRRTEANLKKIEDGASSAKNEFFEITQLINSAVGILMWPNESLLDLLPDIPLDDVKVALPRTIFGKYKDNNIKAVVSSLRNAIAHHNIEFESQNNEILGLYLWSQDEPKGKPTWVGYISTADLRDLFSFLAKEFRKTARNAPAKNSDAITRLDMLLAAELKEEGKQTLRMTNPASFR